MILLAKLILCLVFAWMANIEYKEVGSKTPFTDFAKVSVIVLGGVYIGLSFLLAMATGLHTGPQTMADYQKTIETNTLLYNSSHKNSHYSRKKVLGLTWVNDGYEWRDVVLKGNELIIKDRFNQHGVIDRIAFKKIRGIRKFYKDKVIDWIVAVDLGGYEAAFRDNTKGGTIEFYETLNTAWKQWRKGFCGGEKCYDEPLIARQKTKKKRSWFGPSNRTVSKTPTRHIKEGKHYFKALTSQSETKLTLTDVSLESESGGLFGSNQKWTIHFEDIVWITHYRPDDFFKGRWFDRVVILFKGGQSWKTLNLSYSGSKIDYADIKDAWMVWRKKFCKQGQEYYRKCLALDPMEIKNNKIIRTGRNSAVKGTRKKNVEQQNKPKLFFDKDSGRWLTRVEIQAKKHETSRKKRLERKKKLAGWYDEIMRVETWHPEPRGSGIWAALNPPKNISHKVIITRAGFISTRNKDRATRIEVPYKNIAWITPFRFQDGNRALVVVWNEVENGRAEAFMPRQRNMLGSIYQTMKRQWLSWRENHCGSVKCVEKDCYRFKGEKGFGQNYQNKCR